MENNRNELNVNEMEQAAGGKIKVNVARTIKPVNPESGETVLPGPGPFDPIVVPKPFDPVLPGPIKP